MPFFHYKASTQSGELIEGQMEADDREAVVRRLQAQGQIPIRAEELRAVAVAYPFVPDLFFSSSSLSPFLSFFLT